MQATIKQKKEIEKLEAWFEGEIVKLKRQELEIMRRYDSRKSQLLRERILKNAKEF